MTTRWGITVPLLGLTLGEHYDALRGLADSGYTDVWSGEHNDYDGFTPLVIGAQADPGLHLGTAIIPAFTRGPGVIAQSAAALGALAPGRFSLGIGGSSPAVVSKWNGIDFDKPFQRTRDVLRFLRIALRGDRVSQSFDTFTIDGFQLHRRPAEPVPVYLAALRPRMLGLAGAEADGVILNWLGAGDVPKCKEAVGNDETPVVARVMVVASEDEESARDTGRRLIAAYLTVPAYAEFQRWLGRGDALSGMWDAWERNDRKAALAAIPDEVVDDLVLHGSSETIREKVQAYADAGADVPVIALLPTHATESTDAVLRTLSELGPPTTGRTNG